MRKCVILAACAVAMVGCGKYNLPDNIDGNEGQDGCRSVQFVMKGLDVDYGTRATLASEGMTDLWVYEGTTLLKHQTSEDSDFGAPTVSLSIGAHDLTFVASKADGQSFSDHWKCTKVKDTYGAVMSYTVSKSSTSKQVELTRCNGKVMWTVEDAVPSGAATMSIDIINQCYGLDANLDGVDADKYSTNVNVTGYVGVTGLSVSAMVLPADHKNGSVVSGVSTFKKADGSVICTYTNDVTVKANQVCNIHGSFFSGSGAHQLSLTTEWGAQTDYDVH